MASIMEVLMLGRLLRLFSTDRRRLWRMPVRPLQIALSSLAMDVLGTIPKVTRYEQFRDWTVRHRIRSYQAVLGTPHSLSRLLVQSGTYPTPSRPGPVPRWIPDPRATTYM